MNYSASDFRLGILGGGQLGKMLLQVTSRLSIKTNILDPSDDSPCKEICSKFTKGPLMDFDTVYDFGKECDLVTYEIEHVNVDALESDVQIKLLASLRPSAVPSLSLIEKSSGILIPTAGLNTLSPP